jgi:hypothetical protein
MDSREQLYTAYKLFETISIDADAGHVDLHRLATTSTSGLRIATASMAQTADQQLPQLAAYPGGVKPARHRSFGTRPGQRSGWV